MSLNLDKTKWTRVKLGDVAVASKEKVDPSVGDVDRYIAGEHMDTDNLRINRWGDAREVDLGPAFHRRFRPGQVLYGSRRTYLRKVAVAEFDGVCANTTYVVETNDGAVLLQSFLPFVMTSEAFHAFAIGESKGSVNPYVNWSDIARYEFDLPPLAEQKSMADLLWAVEEHLRSLSVTVEALETTLTKTRDEMINYLLERKQTQFSECWGASPESGFSAPPVSEETGRYVLSLAAITLNGYRPGQLKNVNESDAIISKTLKPGDLLISRANTADKVGRAVIFPENRSDVSFPDTMMRLHMVPEVLAEFAQAVIASTHGRKHMRRTAAGSATSMVKINRQSLGRMPFPMASASEQQSVILKIRVLSDTSEQMAYSREALENLRAALLNDIFGVN